MKKPEIIINEEFVKSWDGVKMMAELQKASEEGKDSAKAAAILVEYYSRMVENIDEVIEAMGGGSVSFDKVIQAINEAQSDELKN